jgi:hypothetical protein
LGNNHFSEELKMSIGYKERECESFLEKFRDDDDPTWGFYVYGSYERAHGNIDEIGSHAQETAGKASQHK